MGGTDGKKGKSIKDDLSKIELVACGPGWLVVDKPCGISIHNDPGNDLCSLLESAVQAGTLPGLGAETTTLHAIHRLDRDTSGIVLLAGDPRIRAFFGEQFSNRKVHKEYLALVHGRMAPGPDHSNEGMWDWPLTADAAGRKTPAGRGKRLPCSTRWRILDHSLHYSLIRCLPESGRKHQIRRHAKLAGHPVVGDRRYGSTRALNYLKLHLGFNRLALHAHRLSIRLPGNDSPSEFSSQGLPRRIDRLFTQDREHRESTAPKERMTTETGRINVDK